MTITPDELMNTVLTQADIIAQLKTRLEQVTAEARSLQAERNQHKPAPDSSPQGQEPRRDTPTDSSTDPA